MPASSARAIAAAAAGPRASTWPPVTCDSDRPGSTDRYRAPGAASRTVSPAASRTSPAAPASTAHGSHGGMAAVAISSPVASPASHGTGQPPPPRSPAASSPSARSPSATFPAVVPAGQSGEQHGNGSDRLGHRAGHRVMAEFLAGDHEVGEAGTEAAVVLGHRQRGDSQLGECPPHGQPRSTVTRGPPAGGGRHLGVSEHVVQRRGELGPLTGPGGHRGSPSNRSAITVRWISFVPA